ncbi:MAG: hypothetical protein ABJD97_12705 [Betaproteobacteria bacterium]
MAFDPTSLRQHLAGHGLTPALTRELDAARAMGNVAADDLGDVILAWLTGLHDEAAPALPRIIRFLDGAIAANEHFGSSLPLHMIRLRSARLIAEWMRTGQDRLCDWESLRRLHLDARADGAFDDATIATDWLADYLRCCGLAGEFEDGVVEYERLHGTRPLSLAKALKPHEVGQAICLHGARGEFDRDAVAGATRKMLETNVHKAWIAKGQLLRAVSWLKLNSAFADRPLTPREVVLSAYDYMPGVTRPDQV